MNKEIFINNFRCFRSFNCELSKVNILIGENSSGKSSFIKLLLALKQTIDEPEISNLILNGSLVDLGNFKETIYYHNENECISFGFMFGDDLNEYTKYFFHYEHKKNIIYNFIKEFTKQKTYIYITIDKNLNDHQNVITKFSNEKLGELEIKINTVKNNRQIDDDTTCDLIYKRISDNTIYTIRNVTYESKAFLSYVLAINLRSEIREQGYNDEIYYEISVFLLTQNLLEIYLKSIVYLNPLSTKPQRIYFKKDAQSSYKENNLEKFANQISNNTISKKSMREFANILCKYGIIDNIELLTSKDFPVSEIKVQIKDLISNIYDVGYGVALQIPILFEAFLCDQKGGNTLLIEQPEVHLHPSLQAKFIDTLLSIGQNNTYIIETHSEHIIRMLQIIVKEKKYKIKPDDIRIYYFSRGNQEFNVSRHFIKSNGQLDISFPSGFYDNSYNLTKSLLF